MFFHQVSEERDSWWFMALMRSEGSRCVVGEVNTRSAVCFSCDWVVSCRNAPPRQEHEKLFYVVTIISRNSFFLFSFFSFFKHWPEKLSVIAQCYRNTSHFVWLPLSEASLLSYVIIGSRRHSNETTSHFPQQTISLQHPRHEESSQTRRILSVLAIFVLRVLTRLILSILPSSGRWRHQGDQHYPRGQRGLREGWCLSVWAAQGVGTRILWEGNCSLSSSLWATSAFALSHAQSLVSHNRRCSWCERWPTPMPTSSMPWRSSRRPRSKVLQPVMCWNSPQHTDVRSSLHQS